MKVCSGCNAVIDDEALFCTSCGKKFEEEINPQNSESTEIPANEYSSENTNSAYNTNNAGYGNYGYGDGNPSYNNMDAAFAVDPTDHTAEFDAEDISANKPFAMLVYIGSIVGLIVSILMKKDSRYLDFHIRQSVKIYIIELLCVLLCMFLSWLIIPMIIAIIAIIVLLVVRVICFVQVAKGQSKEPEIIKSIGFLK